MVGPMTINTLYSSSSSSLIHSIQNQPFKTQILLSLSPFSFNTPIALQIPHQMRRSSSSSSSCRSESVVCYHNLTAVKKMATKGSHVGKLFYGCPLWPQNGCRFFQLVEEMPVEIGSRALPSEVEYLVKNYDEKLKKLKLKNEKLRLEVTVLKGQVVKHSKGEKIVMFGLIISWIIFAFSWMFKA